MRLYARNAFTCEKLQRSHQHTYFFLRLHEKTNSIHLFMGMPGCPSKFNILKICFTRSSCIYFWKNLSYSDSFKVILKFELSLNWRKSIKTAKYSLAAFWTPNKKITHLSVFTCRSGHGPLFKTKEILKIKSKFDTFSVKIWRILF